jgi:fructose-1,6-bisphosphatase/inositol monophosphatase family enzyme
MMADAAALLDLIRAIHDRIRDAVVSACERQSADSLSAVASEEPGDTIYAVDRVSEGVLLDAFGALAREEPLCLVAEGIPGGSVTLPRGALEADCRWRVLIDPIDGTRGLMYQKRSAWILTGVAPNRGPATRLSDIVLAVQTEIPLIKQHLCDQLWARRGGGMHAVRTDRVAGTTSPVTLHASRAHTLRHGFASVVRFFPGARDELAALDDALMFDMLGPFDELKAPCFEDQYLSTGGQLFELMAGHDRFIADLRPLVQPLVASRGLPRGLCCHPYDLCTALIAEEAGVVLTAADGTAVDAPFDIDADVAWVGYANEDIRAGIEPRLLAILRSRGLLPVRPA